MNTVTKHIVIVGGGSAGWITAGVIAAEHVNSHSNIQVTLIESPDISPIGVGEGTWPSMRSTLEKMRVSETDFFRECDSSFKQGSKFSGWISGNPKEIYYHPFTPPSRYHEINLANHWFAYRDKVSFADAVCVQSHLCEKNLAPKQIATPEYAGLANYGYHLDAGKFSTFLHKHCVEKLGVNYIRDNVIVINSADNGDIKSLTTNANGDVNGDLFIDCTGMTSLLIGTHYKIPFITKKDILFNDTALAVQIPYPDIDSPIVSHTLSTAQTAGWIWDIGLPSRRGTGHVFSSAHISTEKAEMELRQYIEPSVGKVEAESIAIRKIKINPGHRKIFWNKNCVAIGLSAGFIEPLEASALVLIELSAQMISEQLPATRQLMDIVAARFNEKFLHHWNRIIDFLKLHYVLTNRRDSDYWIDNCEHKTIPQSLQNLLELWKYQTPWSYDELFLDEMFPSASFQYVLYGMNAYPAKNVFNRQSNIKAATKADELFRENIQKTNHLLSALPTNRELINKIKQYGFQKI